MGVWNWNINYITGNKESHSLWLWNSCALQDWLIFPSLNGFNGVSEYLVKVKFYPGAAVLVIWLSNRTHSFWSTVWTLSMVLPDLWLSAKMTPQLCQAAALPRSTWTPGWEVRGTFSRATCCGHSKHAPFYSPLQCHTAITWLSGSPSIQPSV